MPGPQSSILQALQNNVFYLKQQSIYPVDINTETYELNEDFQDLFLKNMNRQSR